MQIAEWGRALCKSYFSSRTGSDPATLTEPQTFRPISMTAHSLAHTRLFLPIKIGNCLLNHRVVHAPTSRCRSTTDFVATDIMLDYYRLRAAYPGTLVIFESTLVLPFSGLSPRKPGAFNGKQRAALGKIFKAIHDSGSFVSVQLVAPGRVADVKLMKQHALQLTAPSAIYVSDAQKRKTGAAGLQLTELTLAQIRQIQNEYVDAAVGIVESGADFVELHGTSGFLVEQFLSPLSNHRSDHYGGSIEGRARFLLELVDRFAAHPQIGAAKTGVRLAPWSTHNGMVYPEFASISDHPALQMTEFLFQEFQKRKSAGNALAYVSIVEPRVSGNADVDNWELAPELNESVLPLFDGPLIRSGAYATKYARNVEQSEPDETVHYAQLLKDVDADDRTLIGLSRPFTSNPDLVERLEKGLDLCKYERPYFYTHTKRGYLTYGKYDEELVFDDDELDKVGVALA